MKELLEPTLENNDEDDNSNVDGDGGGGGGGECNEVAAVAAKSTNDNDNYSNDDGDDGSDSGGKCNDKKYDNDNDGGGGKCSPTGKGLYYPDDDAFLDDIFDDDYVKKHFSTITDKPACNRNRNRIMGGPRPPGPNALEEEKRSYKGKQKAFTNANCRKLLTAVSSVDMNVLPQK